MGGADLHTTLIATKHSSVRKWLRNGQRHHSKKVEGSTGRRDPKAIQWSSTFYYIIETFVKGKWTRLPCPTDWDTDALAVCFEQNWFCPEQRMRMHYRSYRGKLSWQKKKKGRRYYTCYSGVKAKADFWKEISKAILNCYPHWNNFPFPQRLCGTEP